MSNAVRVEPLLVELLCEELPPKALQTLGEAFARGLEQALRAEGLVEGEAAAEAFASPRRLAARLAGVRDQAPEQSLVHKLMPVSVGLDAEGRATPALFKTVSYTHLTLPTKRIV